MGHYQRAESTIVLLQKNMTLQRDRVIERIKMRKSMFFDVFLHCHSGGSSIFGSMTDSPTRPFFAGSRPLKKSGSTLPTLSNVKAMDPRRCRPGYWGSESETEIQTESWQSQHVPTYEELVTFLTLETCQNEIS
jgi:hypothetical protein